MAPTIMSPKEPSPARSSGCEIWVCRELNSRARGDLYVHLDVQVPKKLNKEQRRLFEQLRDLLPADNRPHEKSVFEKVRDLFTQ